MSKFLLPFREGPNSLQTFSSTAMFASALLVGVAASIQTDPRVVLIMLLVLFIGGTIAGTRWRIVLILVAKIEVFILLLLLLEPFLLGTTALFTIPTPWGPVNTYLEGAMLGTLLGLRMFFLVTLFAGTLSHMSLSDFMGALKFLHVPITILASLLIMLRYIPVFMSERTRMQQALSLRGFERGERASRMVSLGYVVGSTIDRAFDRSREVYESMTLRGLGRGMTVKAAGLRRADAYLAVLVGLAFLSLWLGAPLLLEVMRI